MSKRNLKSVDLNLLLVLNALIEERHITRASERLNISQSAMSKSLSRVRDTFDDPILVRMPNGYELSDRSKKMREPLKQILSDIEELLSTEKFDPLTSTRKFTISALDYAEFMVGYKLMERIQSMSPFSTIEFVPRTANSFNELINGSVDVILSLKQSNLPGNIETESVIYDEMICVIDKTHPLANQQITLDTFLEYPHSVLHTGSDELVVDKELSKLNKTRKILKISPNFVASVTSIKDTNMILTVPKCMVYPAMRLVDLEIHKVPFATPKIEFSLYWHKRNTNRRAHKWYRSQFKNVIVEEQVNAENVFQSSNYLKQNS
jgi:DNA-binding transcriptional LysR family regulator